MKLEGIGMVKRVTLRVRCSVPTYSFIQGLIEKRHVKDTVVEKKFGELLGISESFVRV